VVDQLGEHVAERGARRRKLLGALRERARHGEDRPLLRLPHGRVTHLASCAERAGQGGHVDPRRVREALGGAADELREDDAGVPPRAHERSSHGVAGLVLLERGHDGAHRLGHVRPGVPVGDGIDVEIVDPRAAGLEGGQGSPREVERLARSRLSR
jgi:hypothetical protein